MVNHNPSFSLIVVFKSKVGIFYHCTTIPTVQIHLSLAFSSPFDLHTGLLPYETVDVAVAAINSKGKGPFSPKVMFRAAEACKFKKVVIL